MKKILMATVALAAFGLSAPASAADLGSRMYTKAPPVAAVPSWAGFYVGGQIGYQWGNVDQTERFTATGTTTSTQSWDIDGAVGGAHIGYNFQFGQFVFGIEGDLEASGMNGSAAGLTPGFVGTEIDGSWQASIRARFGIVAWNNLLIYGTAGIAWADLDRRYSFTFGGPNPSLPGDFFSSTEAGFTIGAGAEWMFARNWSARVEYRYTDFGTITDVAPASLPLFNYENDINFHTVRFGVSYHFN